MKKKTLRLLVCTALTVVALSFNACGDGKESKDTSEDSTSVSEIQRRIVLQKVRMMTVILSLVLASMTRLLTM